MAGAARVPVSLVVPRRWPGWLRGRGGSWGPSGAHPRGAASPADPAMGASPGGRTPAPNRPAAGCTERAGALRGGTAPGHQLPHRAHATTPQGASKTLPQLHPFLPVPAAPGMEGPRAGRTGRSSEGRDGGRQPHPYRWRGSGPAAPPPAAATAPCPSQPETRRERPLPGSRSRCRGRRSAAWARCGGGGR